MAPHKRKGKAAEEASRAGVDKNDLAGSENERDASDEEDASPSRFKCARNRPSCIPKSKAKSVIGLNMMGPSIDLRHHLKDMAEEGEGSAWRPGEEECARPGWMSSIISEVTATVKEEVRELIAQQNVGISPKDIDDVKAAQRNMDLQAEAARLNSEGAQMLLLAKFAPASRKPSGSSKAMTPLPPSSCWRNSRESQICASTSSKELALRPSSGRRQLSTRSG